MFWKKKKKFNLYEEEMNQLQTGEPEESSEEAESAQPEDSAPDSDLSSEAESFESSCSTGEEPSLSTEERQESSASEEEPDLSYDASYHEDHSEETGIADDKDSLSETAESSFQRDGQEPDYYMHTQETRNADADGQAASEEGEKEPDYYDYTYAAQDAESFDVENADAFVSEGTDTDAGRDAEAGDEEGSGEDQNSELSASGSNALSAFNKRRLSKRKKLNLNLPFLRKNKEESKKEINDIPIAGSELNKFNKTKDVKPPWKILALVIAVILVVGAMIFFLVRNLRGSVEGKVYVESVAEITGLGSTNGVSNRYTGEVEAQDSWKITLQNDMSVAKCFVNVGDEVQQGDDLFSYNTEELKLNKEKRELEVETLTNEMNQLKKDIAGYENDLKTASASEKIELQTQILTAQTTIKKDEFTIKSSQEDIANLEKNIKDATIKSKMAGVVKTINKSIGNSSSDEEDSGDDTGDNVYMTILGLGDYRVKGKVSEANVWLLNEGDPVIVRSRVDDTALWKGTISKIKTDANADTQESGDADYDLGDMSGDSASTYNFYVKLDNDEGLMMGQHVLIEPDNGQDEEKSGLWLNTAYLHIDGDNYYVWVSNSRDRLTLRKVKVGEYNEEMDDYEILDGLALSDYIAADSDQLRENMRTTKVNSEADSTAYYDEEENDDDIYDDDVDEMEEYDEEDEYDEEGLEDNITDADLFVDESGNNTDDGTGADVIDGSGNSNDDMITIN